MTKKEKKQKAQDLIMSQIAIIGYGERFNEYIKELGGNEEEATAILKDQMDRVAKIFGFNSAWFQ